MADDDTQHIKRAQDDCPRYRTIDQYGEPRSCVCTSDAVGPCPYPPYEHEVDNTILAYLKFRGPLPEPGPPIRFTVRQRIRIARYNLKCAIQQWIHDHLPEAHCDN